MSNFYEWLVGAARATPLENARRPQKHSVCFACVGSTGRARVGPCPGMDIGPYVGDSPHRAILASFGRTWTIPVPNDIDASKTNPPREGPENLLYFRQRSVTPSDNYTARKRGF